MNQTAERYTHKPNLMKVALELSRCKNPEKAVNALVALLAAEPEILQTERFLEGGRTGWQASRR